ncbi:unnamed protein product [Lampetra fluviatilis]
MESTPLLRCFSSKRLTTAAEMERWNCAPRPKLWAREIDPEISEAARLEASFDSSAILRAPSLCVSQLQTQNSPRHLVDVQLQRGVPK